MMVKRPKLYFIEQMKEFLFQEKGQAIYDTLLMSVSMSKEAMANPFDCF
jgi:hypothetical protein